MEVCRKYFKLHQKIKDLPVAMLTMIDREGSLQSFPMYTVQSECEGSLWFFVSFDAQRVKEMEYNKGVNLSYSSVEKGIYVSISGKAEFVRDQEKIQELWKPIFENWLPKGKHDSQLSLLKVKMENASCWDAADGCMSCLWDITEALAVEKEQQSNH